MVEKISKRPVNVLGLDLVRAVKKMPEVVETWVQWQRGKRLLAGAPRNITLPSSMELILNPC